MFEQANESTNMTVSLKRSPHTGFGFGDGFGMEPAARVPMYGVVVRQATVILITYSSE